MAPTVRLLRSLLGEHCAGPRQDDEQIQNEIFGPLINVQQFTEENEALVWVTACSTDSPPACGPATSARQRMNRRLDFGRVWINTHNPIVAEIPHRRFTPSGGKDLSMYGFEDHPRIKHIMANNDS